MYPVLQARYIDVQSLFAKNFQGSTWNFDLANDGLLFDETINGQLRMQVGRQEVY